MKIHIEPCPHCGPKFGHLTFDSYFGPRRAIMCERCKRKGPIRIGMHRALWAWNRWAKTQQRRGCKTLEELSADREECKGCVYASLKEPCGELLHCKKMELAWAWYYLRLELPLLRIGATPPPVCWQREEEGGSGA